MGYTCYDYKVNQWCEDWDPAWGPLSYYANNDGIDASQACQCFDGGKGSDEGFSPDETSNYEDSNHEDSNPHRNLIEKVVRVKNIKSTNQNYKPRPNMTKIRELKARNKFDRRPVITHHS